MKHKIIFLILMILIVIFVSSCGYSNNVNASIKSSERIYECDYHTWALNTHISFKYNSEEYDITGHFITFLTDPLTLKKGGAKIGYADDSYHIIGQDDHCIFINDMFEVAVNGNFEWLGNSYDLYNQAGQKIGYAEFSEWCTSGAIYDALGNQVVYYSKSLMLNDYTVKIYDNDICSDLAMLMIVASYVSDYHADEGS